MFHAFFVRAWNHTNPTSSVTCYFGGTSDICLQHVINIVTLTCWHFNTMATASRAPKQWQLTKTETINTFENWRQNLIYILSLDSNFVPFLNETWLKKSTTNPLRGLEDDEEDAPNRLTAVQKNAHLDLLLGQIANYCPVISRNSIVKNSTSLNDIWQKIRQHFGFASTGAHFLDLCSISLQPDERAEDLFQRLTAFFEDNLLSLVMALPTMCNDTICWMLRPIVYGMSLGRACKLSKTHHVAPQPVS